MRGIRRWLLTASCTLATVSAFAQTPVGKPSTRVESPPVDSDLPAGKVVGGSNAPIADVTISAIADPPVPMPPVEKAPESPATKPVIMAIEEAKAPLVAPPGMPMPPQPDYTSNCCGPFGSHGPIGQEVYVRAGWNSPQGKERLVFNLDEGCAGQVGLRSQFFNTTGSAAWVVDTHIMYMYNEGVPKDIHTFNREPVVVTALHRTAVGLGLGRDWFLMQPGFILDTWDVNFRFGVDGGGRWGSGHVNLRNPFEEDSYRRHQDTFTQVFVGAMATIEVPFGGWTFLFGGRVEWDYMWSNFLPMESNFQEYTGYLVFGARY